MTIEEQELFESMKVDFSAYYAKKGKPPWSASFALNVKGYRISHETEKFDEIDQAVSALKTGVTQALKDFREMSKGENEQQ